MNAATLLAAACHTSPAVTAPRECVMDVRSAIRWVRANAKALRIDPNRIAAGGGSAGGHVAAATAPVRGSEAVGARA